MSAKVKGSWTMTCKSCGIQIRGVATEKSARFFAREHNKAVHKKGKR